MKLDLGSGNAPLNGYASVDLVPPADFVGDFLEMDFENVEAVEMSHVLEHIPFRRGEEALLRVRSWMVPGGALRVEVPDADELLHLTPEHPDFNQWWFGSQEGPGQFHRAGFNTNTLLDVLARAGWAVQGVQAFVSGHPQRVGYPCLSAVCTA